MSNEVYEIITERIVRALEEGTIPWEKPWKASSGLPRSISTGKTYSGINLFLLGISGMASGYGSPWWGSYRAITEAGGQVRKGEKSTQVTFWKTYGSVVEEDDGGEEIRTPARPPVLRYYRVFNAEQADGLPERYYAAPANAAAANPIDSAEEILSSYLDGGRGPSVSYGGDRACYDWADDEISLPHRESFVGPEDFYSTAFHEMVHSTGHRSRLARPDLLESHAFGDESYAKEELVAEMGAAMLSGVAGIEQTTLKRSAAYLQNWASVLKGDSRLVISAASQAQKAADFVRGINLKQAVATEQGGEAQGVEEGWRKQPVLTR